MFWFCIANHLIILTNKNILFFTFLIFLYNFTFSLPFFMCALERLVHTCFFFIQQRCFLSTNKTSCITKLMFYLSKYSLIYKFWILSVQVLAAQLILPLDGVILALKFLQMAVWDFTATNKLLLTSYSFSASYNSYLSN